MPFLHPGLLRLLALRGAASPAPALAAEGPEAGRLQPLAAWYALRALPAVEAHLAADRRALAPLLHELGAAALPRAEALRLDDPERIFLNVNTPRERERAEALARESGGAAR